MARIDLVHPDSAEAPWLVDTRRIRCDAARHWAPGLIGRDGEGLSFVDRRPEDPEEVSALWRASVACPTQSIVTSKARRRPSPAFGVADGISGIASGAAWYAPDAVCRIAATIDPSAIRLAILRRRGVT